MISLKKFIDQKTDNPSAPYLDCCTSLLHSVAENTSRVCPAVAQGIRENLLTCSERLRRNSTPAGIVDTQRQIERELDAWGEVAAAYYKQKADDIREVMLAMTEAANSVGQRDERYSAQMRQIAGHLQEASSLDDVSRVRELIRGSAGALTESVTRMMEEGAQSVLKLQSQLSAYERKLAEAERASLTDSLTGLANRGAAEREIALRLRVQRQFSLLIVDLNGFKAVNDTHGHAAGDHLLKTFAEEFRAQARNSDLAGRWGGDEFVMLVDGGPDEASQRCNQIRNWVLGEYVVPAAPSPVKVAVSAAIGVAVASPGKSAEALFTEADRAMYADKRSSR